MLKEKQCDTILAKKYLKMKLAMIEVRYSLIQIILGTRKNLNLAKGIWEQSSIVITESS